MGSSNSENEEKEEIELNVSYGIQMTFPMVEVDEMCEDTEGEGATRERGVVESGHGESMISGKDERWMRGREEVGRLCIQARMGT